MLGRITIARGHRICRRIRIENGLHVCWIWPGLLGKRTDSVANLLNQKFIQLLLESERSNSAPKCVRFC